MTGRGVAATVGLNAYKFGSVPGPRLGPAPLILFATIRQQSRLLSERHDPTWPLFDRFLKRCSRDPVVTGKSDQLLHVPILVVPKFNRVRKIVRPPHCHLRMGEHNRNTVN